MNKSSIFEATVEKFEGWIMCRKTLNSFNRRWSPLATAHICRKVSLVPPGPGRDAVALTCITDCSCVSVSLKPMLLSWNNLKKEMFHAISVFCLVRSRKGYANTKSLRYVTRVTRDFSPGIDPIYSKTKKTSKRALSKNTRFRSFPVAMNVRFMSGIVSEFSCYAALSVIGQPLP